MNENEMSNTSSQLLAARTAAIATTSARGYALIRFKTGEVVARQTRPSTGQVSMMGWRSGSSAKHAFYYLFRNWDRAETFLRTWMTQQNEMRAYRAKQTAERQAKRANLTAAAHWSVGDVGYTSWGYDQTNVDFFQVVRLLPRSVVVRQVRENSSDHGQPGGGRTAPRRWDFAGPEQVCPLREDGAFTAGPCHGKDRPSYRHHVSKWTGSAVYTSSDR